MLKSIHRLSTKQFMEVMEKGRIYTSPLFVIRILLLQGQTSRSDLAVKFAAVAPKKVVPSAVQRNKIRRQIYEMVEPRYKSILSGSMVIIFAKKETISASFEAKKIDLAQLFAKAKISV